jgi:hypothetical protein
VVLYSVAGSSFGRPHDALTRKEIGKRLADLKGFTFGGEFDPARDYPGALYFVPNDTICSIAAAQRLGIRDERDLFGGVAPHPFVATKAITHPLVGVDAQAPAGWSPEFAQRIRDVVPSGYTAFAIEDARRAAALLLRRGAVRIKPANATGGQGQMVVRKGSEVNTALDRIDLQELSQYGLVLEENLTDVTTYSLGQICVADLLVTCYGTQRVTRDNDGSEVYGGSDLVLVRGDFEALSELGCPSEVQVAVAQARVYDAAAMECFPGLFASRRNYDVARGNTAAGMTRSGVLEQSWRIGGASIAEVAAIEAFCADPGLNAVQASSTELYGEGIVPPKDAVIYFQGVDERIGPLIKYAQVAAL